MSGHTAGKWKSFVNTIFSNWDGKMYLIHEAENEANARLIASAPELLEVCEFMAKKAFMRKWDGDEKAFDMLEKALKKAGSEVKP